MKRTSLLNSRRVIKLGLFVAFIAVLSLIFSQIRDSQASIAFPPIPQEHYKYIDDAVEHCDVPKNMRGFIAAVAYAESTFKPGAESGAGAVGVMQLLRGTGFGVAQKYGISGLNAETFKQADISYKMGTCYLHYLMTEVVGDTSQEAWENKAFREAILVGYNAGPARGKSLLRGAYNGPISSRHYASKIERAKSVYDIDFARYDQLKQETEESAVDVLAKVRELIWSILLRQEN